jgi:lipoprotein-releasing system permease protein
MSFESFISHRYLRAKKTHAFINLITWLSVAGVAVGVMALIVVIGVMSGFEADLKSRILGIDSHIKISGTANTKTPLTDILPDIMAVEGVLSAMPYVETQTMIKTRAGVSGAAIKGIEPRHFSKAERFLNELSLEKLKADTKPAGTKNVFPKIVLGKQLGVNLGVLPGDYVYLVSPRGNLSPIGYLPSMRKFEVVGFFSTGMYEYDSALGYVHIDQAQKFLFMGEGISGIDVWISDIYQVDGICARLKQTLDETVRIRSWKELNKNLFFALNLEKTAMFVILVLIIFVAALNIASALIMMVMEKTKDIAILKAMGTTKKSVRKIFVYKGLMIGGLGTIIGKSLGLLLAFLLKRYEFIKLPEEIYLVTTIPVELNVFDVLTIGCCALAICFVATLYPAVQASRMNPVAALRYG